MATSYYLEGSVQVDGGTDYDQIYFVLKYVIGSVYGEDEPVFYPGHVYYLKSSNLPHHILSIIPSGYYPKLASTSVIFDDIQEPVSGAELIRYEVEVVGREFWWERQKICKDFIKLYNEL